MAKINDLPLLPNPTADMYCLVGKGDLQKVPWSAIMGQIGSPYIATTAAGMTDKTRVYVYQGSESGYTSGNWYYWNGSAWTSGGTYNSAAVDTDKTLTQSDKPADSAIVGKEIGSLKESIGNVNEEISGLKGVGSGLTTEQKRYIVSLFKSAVYSENMSDMVTALENSFNTIPATGIKLSPTTLKFSGIGDTQKITATLTPDTATSSILWESNNTDVVTVKDGVATAVSDGIATITATSGSATAKCNVTVNTKELYSVSNKICNADFYEATGLKFGSDTANGWNKSWTLFMNCSIDYDQNVYGLNNDIQEGMDLRVTGNGNANVYFGRGSIKLNLSSNRNVAYVAVHEANANNLQVYQYSDDNVTTTTVTPFYSRLNDSYYDGEVCVGGNKQATYTGAIHDFSIVMRKVINSEIETYLKGCVY